MAFIFGLETLQDILWAPTDTLDHISHASTDSPHLSTRDAEKYWKSMIFEKIQNVPKSNAECFLAAFLGSGCPYNTPKIRLWQYDIIIFILRMLIESLYFGQFAPKIAFFSKFTFASNCPIGQPEMVMAVFQCYRCILLMILNIFHTLVMPISCIDPILWFVENHVFCDFLVKFYSYFVL